MLFIRDFFQHLYRFTGGLGLWFDRSFALKNDTGINENIRCVNVSINARRWVQLDAIRGTKSSFDLTVYRGVSDNDVGMDYCFFSDNDGAFTALNAALNMTIHEQCALEYKGSFQGHLRPLDLHEGILGLSVHVPVLVVVSLFTRDPNPERTEAFLSVARGTRETRR